MSEKNVEVAMVKFKLLFWHLPGETEESSKIPQSHQLVPALILKLGILTHCGRVTQICVFNTVKLGTSASSP